MRTVISETLSIEEENVIDNHVVKYNYAVKDGAIHGGVTATIGDKGKITTSDGININNDLRYNPDEFDPNDITLAIVSDFSEIYEKFKE